MRDVEQKFSAVRLCVRLIRYPLRRWRGLSAVLVVMLVRTGIDVLKPLPMKVLVDNVLAEHEPGGILSTIASIAPGAASREGLLVWTVVATIGLFDLASE
jgi:hypothetical protein